MGEVEDGMGWGGLVPTKAEREQEKALTAAYAEGRRDEAQELASVLPGSYYMDPPDGGSVTVMEQLRRMADDAAKWRNQAGLRSDETCPSCKGAGTQVFYGPDPDWPSEEGQCERCGGTGAVALREALPTQHGSRMINKD